MLEHVNKISQTSENLYPRHICQKIRAGETYRAQLTVCIKRKKLKSRWDLLFLSMVSCFEITLCLAIFLLLLHSDWLWQEVIIHFDPLKKWQKKCATWANFKICHPLFPMEKPQNLTLKINVFLSTSCVFFYFSIFVTHFVSQNVIICIHIYEKYHYNYF